MAELFLIDSDVVIEYLRGRPAAVQFMERLEGKLLLSAITVAELFAGLKGDTEERALEQFLLAFEVLPIDEHVARVAGALRREYGTRHGTGLADALLAATAQARQATLVTFNIRHFPMLNALRTPYRRS